jgi:hypothetical protein
MLGGRGDKLLDLLVFFEGEVGKRNANRILQLFAGISGKELKYWIRKEASNKIRNRVNINEGHKSKSQLKKQTVSRAQRSHYRCTRESFDSIAPI